MKAQKTVASTLIATIVGIGAGPGECKRAICALAAEQPHVPHEPHGPTPVGVVFEVLTSGSSSEVPFVPFDNSAAEVAIRAHYAQRASRVALTTIAPSSVLTLT